MSLLWPAQLGPYLLMKTDNQHELIQLSNYDNAVVLIWETQQLFLSCSILNQFLYMSVKIKSSLGDIYTIKMSRHTGGLNCWYIKKSLAWRYQSQSWWAASVATLHITSRKKQMPREPLFCCLHCYAMQPNEEAAEVQTRDGNGRKCEGPYAWCSDRADNSSSASFCCRHCDTAADQRCR